PQPAHAAGKAALSAQSDDSDWPAMLMVGAGAAALLAGCVVVVRRRAATVARRTRAGDRGD
ncbi:hypothetical protein ABZ369_30640, partial [Streptomyces sp. NPDC005918]